MSRRLLMLLSVLMLATTSGIVMAAEAGESGTPQGDGKLRPTIGHATRHDVSGKLELLAKQVPVIPQEDREVPLGIPHKVPSRTNAVEGEIDALVQVEARPFPETAATPQPTLNFEGLSDDDNSAILNFRVVPPDTEGDVGINYYVQWINSIFAIYDKTTGNIAPGGGPFAGNTIWAGFGGFCESNNDGDPIVLYDHLEDRWLMSQFSIDEGVQCVALSQTSDPRGPYDRWAFVVSPGQANDYPKFGMMPDAYYLSLRDFPSSDGDFASAVAFDKAAMLQGASSPTFVKYSLPCLSNDCPDGIQPPHLEGPPPAVGTPGYFTRYWDDNYDGPLTGSDGYRIWEFVPDFVNPGNSTFTELSFVTGANYDSNLCGFFGRNCIPQASSSQLLDSVDELQMYRAQYRHWGSYDTLLVSTTVDAGGDTAGVRWGELRNYGSGWTLHQEGTYAPGDGLERWMSSIAMDGAGNIALGYSVSGTTIDPAVRYTTRLVSDPLGLMPGGEVELIAGAGAQTGANRWGDYSTMSVDPVDDCTFWYTQEYYANTASFDFKTRIGTFKIPGCDGPGPECGNDILEAGEECDGTDFGTAQCEDYGCSGGSLNCTPSCTIDISGCTDCPVCDNDGLCEADEDCNNCPNDCISGTTSGAICGNGVCEAGDGEDCVSCPADCNGNQVGKPSGRFCCGDGDGKNPVSCDDARCTSGGVTCTDVPVGGGVSYCCGDGTCEGLEDSLNCAIECDPLPPVCGDQVIEGLEVCDGDNLGGETCTSLGLPDGTLVCLSDCSAYDTSGCTGTTCGSNKASCSVNSDCCSGVCKSGTCRGN